MSEVTLESARRMLRQTASPKDAAFLSGFFKTGPGQYGEGDLFLGVRVPASRKVARAAAALGMDDTRALLHSPYHEERLLALLILVRQFERGRAEDRRRVFDFYLSETRHINNWDLVDLSAPGIVGAWLLDQPNAGARLDALAKSASLWERRIGVLATLAFIRKGRFSDTLRLCQTLLGDREDLMHKACGWMLRETGKRDEAVLEGFLEAHAAQMPRTMLRYAIERLAPARRQFWMACRTRAGLL